MIDTTPIQHLRKTGQRWRALHNQRESAASDLRAAIILALDHGLTQAEVAQILKLTQSRVSQIIHNKS